MARPAWRGCCAQTPDRAMRRSPHSRLARMCWAPGRSPRSLAVPRRIAIRKWHASRSVPQLSRDIPRLEPRPPRPRQSSGSPWGRPRGRRDSLACYGGGSGIATGRRAGDDQPAADTRRCPFPLPSAALAAFGGGLPVTIAGRTGRTGVPCSAKTQTRRGHASRSAPQAFARYSRPCGPATARRDHDDSVVRLLRQPRNG
jgi:hypothetical protein